MAEPLQGYRGVSTQTHGKLYGFKKPIAWQKADDLAAQVHEVAIQFGHGYWRLADQMRSAAVSVKSNFALPRSPKTRQRPPTSRRCAQ